MAPVKIRLVKRLLAVYQRIRASFSPQESKGAAQKLTQSETKSVMTATADARSRYTTEAPSDDLAIALFDGSWTSQLPGRNGPGQNLLFDDIRIRWLIEKLGSVENMNVLELGPLEGGHTWMLEQAGASVTAVEANQSAFMRCLVAHNLLGMNSKFMLGDFTKGLPSESRWDLVVASGVLYHLKSPEQLLSQISEVTDRIFIWTHYFEPDGSKWNADLDEKLNTKWRPDRTVVRSCHGIDVRLVPMYYEESVGWSGFCGGPDDLGNWLYREDLLELLRALGFTKQEIAFDQPNFVNGPSFAVLATR